MFQPQPTPFAASCFNSYGVSDLSFPLTLQTLPGASTSSHSHHASDPTTAASQQQQRPAGDASAPPPQAPRHPSSQHHPQSRQRQQHPPSLLYNASAASASVSPVASSHGHFSPAPPSHSLSSPYSHATPPRMEQQQHENATGGLMQEELAAQEAAARDYQPRLEGPLVGEKVSSNAISEEYAKADPIYVEKTLALPNVYSHYRPIQGDGNCGWRAIGFSYFETLIQQGDRHKVEAEVARITSLDQVLLTVGYDRFLFEDMTEETVTLLRDIAARMDSPAAASALLLERFNNREVSAAIIYHLRLLAASWLKGDPSLYEPFIPNGIGVTGYCTDVIERPDCEIEQLGVMLLVNVLLKPVGFALEIAYLDRSPGSQVNVYRFPDDAPPGSAQDGDPVIYLLFRPDHYDILYRPPPVSLQVHRATSFTHNHDVTAHREPETFSSLDYTPLTALLPSFSYAPGPMGAGLGSETLATPMGGGFVPAVQQQQQWMPFSDGVSPRPAQTPSEPTLSRAAPSPAPSSAAGGSVVGAPPVSKNTYPLRFSSQYYKLDGSSFPEPSFTTAMFKNSHYNKAHYSNPHFHPEEWTPDEGCGGKRRGRKNEG